MQLAGYEGDEAVPGAAVILEHPAGGKVGGSIVWFDSAPRWGLDQSCAPELQVYLVAVSHASHRAPADVADCILATNPAVIALEIDQVRGLGTSTAPAAAHHSSTTGAGLCFLQEAIQRVPAVTHKS